MAERSKKMIVGGAVATALAMLLALADLISGFPYAGQTTMDILWLVAGAIVLYMCYDAFQDLA